MGYSNNPFFKIRYSTLRKYDNNIENTSDIDFLPLVKFTRMFAKESSKEITYQDFGIFKKFYFYLKNKSRCELCAVSCSSQYGSYIFDPNGDIYTCLETVGKEEHIIGHYIKGKIEWTDAKKHWFERNISNISHCKQCKYALLCGGGCPAHIPYTQNGFGTSTCNNFQAVFPTSINRAYTAYINNKLF